ASALVTRDIRLKVPETVRIVLRGTLARDCTAKDVMLTLFRDEVFRTGGTVGRVLEFTGPGLAGLSFDERATLTNMSVEASGFTGIMEPDETALVELARLRGVEPNQLAE